MFMDIMPEINGDVSCVPLADYWANHFKSFLFNGICPCFPARWLSAIRYKWIVRHFSFKKYGTSL